MTHNQLRNPLALAVSAKMTSIVQYYFDTSLHGHVNHPLSGAGFPGVFALSSGYLSFRVGNLASIPSDVTTAVSSGLSALVQGFVSHYTMPKAFCGYDSHSATRNQTNNNKASYELVGDLNRLEFAGQLAFFSYGYRKIFDKVVFLAIATLQFFYQLA